MLPPRKIQAKVGIDKERERDVVHAEGNEALVVEFRQMRAESSRRREKEIERGTRILSLGRSVSAMSEEFFACLFRGLLSSLVLRRPPPLLFVLGCSSESFGNERKEEEEKKEKRVVR